MSILNISNNNIIFESKEVIKNINLTNTSQMLDQRKPIMFKIKTNKIQHVDAKPSCGYISAKEGHNQIVINIRALKNTQFTAKLQIMFISHELITEEIVQRNKHHFDIEQYNRFYDSLKKSSSLDAKTAYISVTKKSEGTSPTNPIIIDSSQNQPLTISQIMNPKKSQIKPEQRKQIKQNKNQNTKKVESSMKMNKLVMFITLTFIIGSIFGYQIAKFKYHTTTTLQQNQQQNQQNNYTEQTLKSSQGKQQQQDTEASARVQTSQSFDNSNKQETNKPVQETDDNKSDKDEQKTNKDEQKTNQQQYDVDPIQSYLTLN